VNRGALTGTRPELWIVDLDRSFLVPELTDAERQTNLRRLLRAILRRESRGSPFLRPPDFARFLRGYDPERARWKDDWRAIAAAHGRAKPWHRAGWLLERAFGANPAARDGAARVG
jgi:hypothetical protein